MTDELKGETVGFVAADCDATQVPETFGRLHELVAAATPDAPVRLDLTGNHPTAYALQFLVAAAKSLDRRGALAGYGPAAQSALSVQS